MDGRDSIALSGSSSSYYLHRGVNVSGSHSNLQSQPVFRPATTNPNPNFPFQASVRESTSDGPQFQVQNTSPNFSHGLNMSVAASTSGEPVKKKRGRPRKYGPGGTNVALGLSPTPTPRTPQSGSITPTERKARGRPRGSGWKQKLAPLGEWMNTSAGLAFTPHVIHVDVGEDIAAKILEFSQQRPRALCILTGHGAVSAVTLRQLTSAATTVTYEGRFQILCLSGSYLVADTGGRNRTGGISVSLCSADGHVIGGGVSELIAASPVQVVVCTFVYGGPKLKTKAAAEPEGEERKPVLLSGEVTAVTLTPPNTTNQNRTPNSSTATWPILRPDMRNPQRDFDLTRG